MTVSLTVIDCGLIYRHTSSVMHLFATVAVFWLYSCLKARLPSTCTAVQVLGNLAVLYCKSNVSDV